MIQESGRSLMEMLGVFAIIGVMTASSLGIYSAIQKSQSRKIALLEIEQIAKNTKLLLELRGDYTGVSVDYLVKAGALKNSVPPIGGTDWSVSATDAGKTFSITLTQLSNGECEYFSAGKPNWAKTIKVNGYELTSDSQCFSSRTNEVAFVIE